MMFALAPDPHSAPVLETERELLAMCAGDNASCRFLRGYLAHASRRLAWNARLVDRHLEPGSAWLDIGSFGLEALWLRSRRPDVHVHATSYEGGDLSTTGSGVVCAGALPDARARLTIDRVDLERDAFPYPDQRFDVVTCFECIEHLHWTPKPLLDEIRRVLKPTGRLLLTTPNVVGSRAMLRLLAGKHPQENPRYHRDRRYGIVHAKEYTLRELAALLEGRGLRVVHGQALYFRRRTALDVIATGVACISRTLGGWALGIGAQPVVMGDNLFVVAQRHDGPLEEWPALVFEPE